MFELTARQIEELKSYKHNVLKCPTHKVDILDGIRKSVMDNHSLRNKLKGLGYPDMRSYNTILAKKELGLSALVALAQVTGHDPAYLSGQVPENIAGYTLLSVQNFLSQYHMEYIIDDTGRETTSSKLQATDTDDLGREMLDILNRYSKASHLSDTEKTLLLLKTVLGDIG